MYDDTIAEFQRSIALSERSVLFAANLGYVYAVSGQKEEAKKIIGDLQSQHDQGDEAMSWLDKAYDARFKASILLHSAFDSLRSDARFQNLLRRIGLPTSKS